VPDTARHGPDDGFHEIQLTGKQLVFLFMATTVVAVVIFLCGVLVGRGVRAEQPASAAAEESASPPPAADAALPAPPAQGAEPSPATAESLSYAQRLQGEEPKEQLKPADQPGGATADPPTPDDAAAAAEKTSPEPSQPPAPDTGKEGGRTDAAGWVVQVAALRDRAAAISIIRRLSSKEYPAFIVEPAAGTAAPSYRVRVGPYQDRREAEAIARRLEREEQFKPFITR
jgi:cell division septation protein DedD